MLIAQGASAVDRPDESSDIVRLVRRVTQGVTSAEIAHAKALGYQGYLEYQLDYTAIDDREAEAFVARTYPSIARPTADIHAIPTEMLLQALQDATLYRAAFSKRQLYQRMVELWTDHFNINFEKVTVYKFDDDREVIRTHALGNFGDLVKASSRSDAMLGSLDQFESVADAPNQNYARELMELHTLGVDGGYTQLDVIELSRVLTGWTFDRRDWGGQFTFDPSIHDWRAKRVMGLDVAADSPDSGADGVKEGERVIELLLAHPSTARFIATKVIKWLLTPTPSETQIATVARVYTETKGDIRSMVRATLNREWLREAPLKFKRPAHLVASALRSLGPVVHGITAAAECVTDAGQPLFKWEAPDGYPDAANYWIGNLLPRWRLANTLVSARSAIDLDVDITAYQQSTPETAVDRMDREFFAGEMPETTRTALVAYARKGTFDDTRIRETLALALSAPAFQWY